MASVSEVSLSRFFQFVVPFAGAGAILLAPVGMESHARSALAIAVAMILAWLVEVLHPALVGFIGSFLFVATGDVEFETAFAGFATTTPWFLYGVLSLFSAADRAGVIERLGARTPRVLTKTWLRAAIALIVLAYLLALVVPSPLATATILAILAVAWAQRVPAWSGSNARMGLVLLAAYAAATFGHAGLPGGPSAIVGWDVAAGIALLTGMFAFADTSTGSESSAVASTGPFDPKVAMILVACGGLWMTSPFHRASPELVGLVAGLICSLPGISRADRHAHVGADPLALIFAGTALSIPAVLIETKAADALSHFWLTTNGFAGMLPQNLVEYWTTTLYRMFSPAAARPALPALDGIASAAGTTATWAYAGSTLLSLHQSPALVFAMAIGGCRARHVLALGLLVVVAGSAVVVIF